MMKTIPEQLTEILDEAFEKAGYGECDSLVRISDRPDLCEFQCNGAMSGAKIYHKSPIEIANAVVENLPQNEVIADICAVAPGFLNLNVDPGYLADCVTKIGNDPCLSVPQCDSPKKILIDYGGPNVAKPLHVGHLRSAVIGESIKRICRAVGHTVLGDIHMGDWGLPIGLIITELKLRKPELVYFDEAYEGEYPAEAPFTISDLEEIYPFASTRSKSDEVYKEAAMEATFDLQNGRRGYRALWEKIMELSVADLKKNYDKLEVSFDLWKAESDAQPYIPDLLTYLKDNGYARISEGALVIDVAEESDATPIPPCMVLKSDGASLYNTTDLATIVERRKLYDPDRILYVVDKRQSLYFTQIFRAAKKAKLVKEDTDLIHIGFGTMNGPDGKPFKTREGGVMRLEVLLKEIEEEMEKKIRENRNVRDEDVASTAATVALSALKYGDLSNQAAKDYIFDMERFTSFEGNTGPYLLYTMVRIKSILEKATEKGDYLPPLTKEEKELALILCQYGTTVEEAAKDLAPHRICAYAYEVANRFNRFYHEVKILTEEDTKRKASYLYLLNITLAVLNGCTGLLGFSAPDHM